MRLTEKMKKQYLFLLRALKMLSLLINKENAVSYND